MSTPSPMHGGPMLRTFGRDRSVTEQHLAPGTLRRILGFARPYRGRLSVFVVLLVIWAVLPLAARERARRRHREQPTA